MKRYTFTIGTFTCLIIGFHSRCVDIAGKKPIDCTHCFSSIINFLHEREEDREESLCSFSTYTKVGGGCAVVELQNKALERADVTHGPGQSARECGRLLIVTETLFGEKTRR